MSETEHFDEQPTEDKSEKSEVEKALQIIDPKDYNQNQRLREIHKARQRVSDVLDNAPYYATKQDHLQSRSRLARAVSLYCMELEPLMNKAEIDDEMFEFPDENPFEDIFEFSYSLGIDPEKGGPVHDMITMEVFRRCNQFMAQVGLDLDIDSQPEPGYLDL